MHIKPFMKDIRPVDEWISRLATPAGLCLLTHDPCRLMTKQEIYKARKFLRKENKRWPIVLTDVLREERHNFAGDPKLHHIRVLRSRSYLVQVCRDQGHMKLAINRTAIGDDGKWVDGLTWDELMEVKKQCGYEDWWAVEVYPPQTKL